jgi:hypothetical protein
MLVSLNYLYETASEQEVSQGLEWYDMASREASRIAVKYSIPFVKVCAVIAHLSPLKSWDTNIKQADELCEFYRNWVYSGYDANPELPRLGFHSMVAKAWSVLIGREDEIDGTFKTKQKIYHFYKNIAGDLDNYVTVDGHATNALNFDIDGRTSITSARTLSPNQYSEAVRQYKAFAELIGVSPAQAQAIIWVTYRNRSL